MAQSLRERYYRNIYPKVADLYLRPFLPALEGVKFGGFFYCFDPASNRTFVQLARDFEATHRKIELVPYGSGRKTVDTQGRD